MNNFLILPGLLGTGAFGVKMKRIRESGKKKGCTLATLPSFLQAPQQLIQKCDQSIENSSERPRIEQISDSAKQVSEKVARPRNGDNVDRDWTYSDNQSEQIEIDWANC